MKIMGWRIQFILLPLIPSTRMKASLYLKMLSGEEGFAALRFLYKLAIENASEREAVLWAYGEYTKLQDIRNIIERSTSIPDERLAIEIRNRINKLISISVSEQRHSIEKMEQKPMLILA